MPHPDYSAIFRRYIASQDEIRLFNVYQGIPISYPAEVLEVYGDCIRIQTEKYQYVCLYREKETYIQTDWLPKVIYARVISMDMPRMQAVLARFRAVTGRVGGRNQVRVMPKDPIQGNIQAVHSSLAVPGELADLSLDGLGIDIHKKHYTPRIVQEGATIAVSFHLPGEYENRKPAASFSPGSIDPLSRFDRANIRLSPLPGAARSGSMDPEETSANGKVISPQVIVHGSIIHIDEEPFHHSIHLGLRILPGDPARAVICQFISRRQSEIMRELKGVSELFY